MMTCMPTARSWLIIALCTLFLIIGVFFGQQRKPIARDLLQVTIHEHQRAQQPAHSSINSFKIWGKIEQLIPEIRDVAPYHALYVPLIFAGKRINATIIGSDESLARILQIQPAQGHFISFVERHERHCIIGHALAQRLQRIRVGELIGQPLLLDEQPYTIVGVAKPWKRHLLFDADINQAVMIPLCGHTLLNRHVTIYQALIKLRASALVDRVCAEIVQHVHDQSRHLSAFIRKAQQHA